MPYRKLEDNLKRKIEQAAVHLGAINGISAVSARNIANECKISTHTIYQFYPSINDLILELATRFENYCLENSERLIKKNRSPIEITDFYLFELTKHKEFTLFYLSFVDKKASDFEYLYNNKQRCLQIAKCVFKLPECYKDKHYLLLYEYVTALTFKFIRKSLTNSDVYDEEVVNLLKNVVLYGIETLIK